jgi:hypothetical protein
MHVLHPTLLRLVTQGSKHALQIRTDASHVLERRSVLACLSSGNSDTVHQQAESGNTGLVGRIAMRKAILHRKLNLGNAPMPPHPANHRVDLPSKISRFVTATQAVMHVNSQQLRSTKGFAFHSGRCADEDPIFRGPAFVGVHQKA